MTDKLSSRLNIFSFFSRALSRKSSIDEATLELFCGCTCRVFEILCCICLTSSGDRDPYHFLVCGSTLFQVSSWKPTGVAYMLWLTACDKAWLHAVYCSAETFCNRSCVLGRYGTLKGWMRWWASLSGACGRQRQPDGGDTPSASPATTPLPLHLATTPMSLCPSPSLASRVHASFTLSGFRVCLIMFRFQGSGLMSQQ